MLANILFIFLPLLAGYFFAVKNQTIMAILRQSSLWIVYLILILLGVNLSAHQNLLHNLKQISFITFSFFILISIANLILLFAVDKSNKIAVTQTRSQARLIPLLLTSCKPIIFVTLGIISGQCLSLSVHSIEQLMQSTLFFLLLLIGFELKHSGLTLREILFNPTGIKISVTVMVTSWIGGLIAGWLTDLSPLTSLTLASGFGWYSLSGILVGDAYGAVLGTASFMIELLRELLAIAIIPVLIHRQPVATIGYAGATAMDFTLPMIQRHGGIQCVPVAIVSGFILSASVPVFMSLFIALAL